MDHPLSYYERRDFEIGRLYRSGVSIEELCDRYSLKERRMRQVLEYNCGILLPRKTRKPKSVEEIRLELGITPYLVRGILIRLEGRWPYPVG